MEDLKDPFRDHGQGASSVNRGGLWTTVAEYSSRPTASNGNMRPRSQTHQGKSRVPKSRKAPHPLICQRNAEGDLKRTSLNGGDQSAIGAVSKCRGKEGGKLKVRSFSSGREGNGQQIPAAPGRENLKQRTARKKFL